MGIFNGLGSVASATCRAQSTIRIVGFCGWSLMGAALTACGGGSEGEGGSDPAPTPTSTPILQQRIDAATATVAHNAACASLTPFYWEIGDAGGALASGSGGDNSGTAPNAATTMQIASASKWIFGAFALQQMPHDQIVSADNMKYLNFTSGYDNMGAACVVTTTVAECFNALSIKGGRNNDLHSADIGKFYYDSGHMQAYATNIVGLGGYYDTDSAGSPALADAIKTQIGQEIAIAYSNPTLAGGVTTTPTNYAIFLRKILANQLAISDYLGADKVCAWTGSSDCNAVSSPINGVDNTINNEKWHYSIGHWVEDDPNVGDGAYSSPGLFGFYPWIDKNKTYYGVLARHDNNISPANSQMAPYNMSINCGRSIRKAWLLGAEQ